jgi:hypothetical protein
LVRTNADVARAFWNWWNGFRFEELQALLQERDVA